jgi:glycosyltransferase involved in cell wall biosynthesis
VNGAPAGLRPGVLILGNYPPPFGGVPTHLEALAPDLVAAGYDVHVISGGDSGVTRHGGVTVYNFPGPERRRAVVAAPVAALRRWRRHFASFGRAEARQLYGYLAFIAVAHRVAKAHRIDAIAAYNLMSYGPVGAVLSSELGLPLVLSSFGEYFKYPDFFRRHADVVEFALARAARRLSMTEHCARPFRDLPAGQPYEVVPYGIDVEQFRPDQPGSAIRRRLGIPDSAVVVLYLARLTQEMGFGVFAEAAPAVLAAAPDVHVLIGGKPEEMHADALEFAAAHPGRVSLETNVPAAELPAFYAAADVVTVPTLNDRACGSLSAAEASATARPVVASRVGGVPEFVRDGETGVLVPPGDAPALAAATLALCRDRERAAAMGRAGRTFACDHLDKRATSRRVRAILDTLTRRPEPVCAS